MNDASVPSKNDGERVDKLVEMVTTLERRITAHELMMGALFVNLRARDPEFERRVIVSLHRLRSSVNDPYVLAEIERLSRFLL